ncbi:MAG TPA: hypothetical protein VHO69_07575, partial [Phototrophicaceae bacterium]|nr:hypothetical protein [Phototrophicaceae bacterium]
LSGVTLPWGAYTAALPTEANGLSEWGGGLNVVQYFRWFVIPGLWSQIPLDFVWKRVDNPLWPLLFGALAIFSGWQMIARLRRMSGLRRGVVSAALLPVLFVGGVYLGLRSIYADPLYQPPAKDTLTAALATLQAESVPGDVLLLSNDTYTPFFLNYWKFITPRVISLPDQPGEQPSPEQPPAIVSDNPDVLLTKETIPLLFNLAGTRERLWLLADLGPWHPWSTRPVERFLAAHYYPLREISTDPTVRLLEYATIDAPDRYAFRGPDVLSDLVYADQIRLAGFTLPVGTVYHSGEVLALSLYWQAEKPVDRDVTVAWFVVDRNGSPVAQGMDSPPDAGFAPSSQWLPGVPVWDNRALRLPETLAPGEYRLWVRLYDWDNGAVQLLPVRGAETADETTGILPIRIKMQMK